MITSKKGEWFELIVPEIWNGITPEQLFRDIWQAPKKLTHLLRMEKEVTVNKLPANWVEPLKTGDRLQVKLFKEADFGVIPAYLDISILYEDDHIIIVNKKAGMDTHPNSAEQANTVANAIAFHLQTKGEYRQIKHIHRLDRDTTGTLLFAKHGLIGAQLDRMLEERKIKRTYIAIVQGIIKQKKGKIEAPIGRDRHHPTRRRVSPNGQHALTHFEVIERNFKKDYTIVRCQLQTGRTHQIRVHFSHLGFPLVGDQLYGGRQDFNRQALHAERIEFIHPLTMETITCNAPAPYPFV